MADDTDLLPDAVEEIMRAPGKSSGGIPRYARADLDIDGVTIRAGELVLLDNGAANHDASAFPDPDLFEVTGRARSHLSFGHGARYCIGAPLARIELQVAFGQLVSHFPRMRLAVPVEDLTLRRDVLTGGRRSSPWLGDGYGLRQGEGTSTPGRACSGPAAFLTGASSKPRRATVHSAV
ncbi:cytochrome P450 [Streptomyces griseus]|uniref:cytochrome P450 n=1 Tax=Streptomyces griseus TaxID=1911 RepID=UPI00381FE779